MALTGLDKEHRWWVVGGALLVALLLALAYKFARPAAPSEVVMSTGGSGGAYETFARRYAVALAEEGITLKLLPSNGAVENLARLQDEKSDVDIAFVQGGIADREKMLDGNLVSLGSMFSLIFLCPLLIYDGTFLSHRYQIYLLRHKFQK